MPRQSTVPSFHATVWAEECSSPKADIRCGPFEAIATEDFAEMVRNRIAHRMMMWLRLRTCNFDSGRGRLMMMLHWFLKLKK
jgi:hypothetical protein